MHRYLLDNIRKDYSKKALLLSGPRQVGKTTLARSIHENHEYLNFDIIKDRKIILAQSWRNDVDLVVIDELHKYRHWENFLKGIIDEKKNRPPLIITGSAKLEVFKKAGDALTGRTYSYHLYPIDLSEALTIAPEQEPAKLLNRLLENGGFPESFFNPEDSRRLLADRLNTVIRDDLRDISLVNNITSIELLIELLRDRVAGQIKYANLAQDISVSAPTVKKWVELLEKLYIIFTLKPYSRKLSKTIRKEPKCFFFDCSAALNGEAAKLENLVALSLLKWIDFEKDTTGRNLNIFYYRDLSGREVDFILTENNSVLACIEVKTSEDKISSSLKSLTAKLKPKHSLQLVKNLSRETDNDGIKVRSISNWLSKINL